MWSEVEESDWSLAIGQISSDIFLFSLEGSPRQVQARFVDQLNARKSKLDQQNEK